MAGKSEAAQVGSAPSRRRRACGASPASTASSTADLPLSVVQAIADAFAAPDGSAPQQVAELAIVLAALWRAG